MFLSDDVGSLNSYQPLGLTEEKRYCCRTGVCAFKSRARCCGFFSGLLILILATGVLTAFLMLPSIVQKSVDAGVIKFDRLQMRDPQEMSVRMIADTTLANVDTHGFGGSLNPSTLSVVYQGTVLGNFVTASIPIVDGTSSFVIDTTLHVTNQTAFTQFASDMLKLPNITIGIRGDISATLKVLGVSLTVSGISFEKSTPLLGLDGMRDLIIKNFKVITEEEGTVKGFITATIFNPSNVDIAPVGSLFMKLRDDKGNEVGKLVGWNVTLLRGLNTVELECTLQGDTTAISGVVARYIRGLPSSLVAHGYPLPDQSCSNPLYNGFVSQLELGTVLTGPVRNLGRQIELKVDILDFLDQIRRGRVAIPAAAQMYNPFQAKIAVTKLELNVLFNKTLVGLTNEAIYIKPINVDIPARAPDGTVYPVYTPFVEVKLLLDAEHGSKLVEALLSTLISGVTSLGLQGQISARVGNLDLVLDFFQDDIPACMSTSRAKCQNVVDHTPIPPM